MKTSCGFYCKPSPLENPYDSGLERKVVTLSFSKTHSNTS